MNGGGPVKSIVNPLGRGGGAMTRSLRDRIADSIRKYAGSPAIALAYDRHYEDTPLLDFDTELLKRELPAGGRLLDIGCGTGRHLVELGRHGLECVGMDLSEYMLELAAAKTEEIRLRPLLLRADMREGLPFRGASFDHVLCMFSTIGLVAPSERRLAFVGDVKRVLRPGGTFHFHVHNRLYNLTTPWGRAWLARTYVFDRLWTDLEVGDRIMPVYRGIDDMYLHVFSLREVRKLLAAAGLELERVHYLNARRDGVLAGKRFASVRANGFILSARKPAQGA